MSCGFDFVTSSDQDYAFFLKGLAWSVGRFLDTRLIVYDLGLEEGTKSEVDAEFIPLDVPGTYKNMSVKNCVRAVHKPACVLDWISRSDRPFVFLDADCLVVQPFCFPACHVGLTFKHYADQRTADFIKNGVINAGVLFFNPQSRVASKLREFLDLWMQGCRMDDQSTDQLVMSDLLVDEVGFVPGKWEYVWHGLEFQILSSEKYNDIRQSTGVIHHFKTAFRNKKKRVLYDHRLENLQTRAGVMQAEFALKRRILSLKGLIRPQKYKYRYRPAWDEFLRQRSAGVDS